MAFMKAAIAGKDDEQFLSDTENDRSLKANVAAPVMPGNAHPASAAPVEVKSVKTSTALRPAVVAPAGISEEDLPVKPALPRPAPKAPPKPVTGVLPPTLNVKPALTPKAVLVKPTSFEWNKDLMLPKSRLSARLGSR
jgi:hypothetical protein